jgi:cytochrome c oxidase cbb3-type subunit 3
MASNHAPGEPDPDTLDAVTGRHTTGHEWDGLKELNTPLPKWWFWTFVATVVWGIGYAIIYPSVPWFNTYFPGVIGYSQRANVAADVKALQAQRAGVMGRLQSMPLAEVKNDPALYAVAMTAGRLTFAENCQSCHGAGGEGRPGFPALAGDAWIWGGGLEDIRTTVVYGIRNGHPEARVAQMPRFGADEVLKPAEIDQVTDFVMTLYNPAAPAGPGAAKGAEVYAENCVACHGDKGQGMREVGGPALRSSVHLYGDTRAAVRAQIVNPRMGVMPAFTTRLDEATIRAVTLYVHGLGGGE